MDRDQIKLVFLGSSGVGKTCLINRFILGKYDSEAYASSSPSYANKVIKYEGEEYSFILWDTPGVEKYRALTKIFLKDVHIIVLVYDITNKTSFLDLQYWLDYIIEKYGSNTFNVLIGNKSDLNSIKEIKESDGSKFAEIIKAKFAHVSAKTNDNWSNIFEDILIDYIKIRKSEEDDYDYADDINIIY